jgi:hypothetical protein
VSSPTNERENEPTNSTNKTPALKAAGCARLFAEKVSGAGASIGQTILLRYFSEPSTFDTGAKRFLLRGLTRAAEWAAQGLVTPHIGPSIDSSLQAINAGLESLKSRSGKLGKIAVTVDPNLGAGSHRQIRDLPGQGWRSKTV